MDRGILWLATGFGLGRSPILPGTIGCLMGLPLGWGLMQINSIGIQMLMAALLVLISIPTMWSCRKFNWWKRSSIDCSR